MEPPVGSLRRASGGRRGWARALGLALALALAGAGFAPASSGAAASPEEIPLPDLTGPGGGEEAETGAPAAPAGVAVLPPQVDPIFEPLREGLREWLAERIVAAGLGVAPRAAVEAALAAQAAAGHPVRHGADAPALAARLDADRVLFSALHFERGQLDLRFHLHDGADPSCGGAVTTGGTRQRRNVARGRA